jgi:hypothetical protein
MTELKKSKSSNHYSVILELNNYTHHQLARVLTQLDRDPDSPSYGCFDRDFWHYKMRDFSSTILQQGIFVLEALRKGHIHYPHIHQEQLAEWSLAAINTLSNRTRGDGSVDEYYPYERSYPSAAFGLYAATRVLLNWIEEDNRNLLDRVSWVGLRNLTHHLSRRREFEATNQQSAGLTALAMAQRIPELCNKENQSAISDITDKLFTDQDEEGWFNEYGGPDFGYLTVTLDSLIDYHDVTRDDRAMVACDRAIAFLSMFVGPDGHLPNTINSRNTDYIVPYGLTRLGARNAHASWIIHTLFQNADNPRHFLWATDDRYHCHYIYTSVVRSLPYLENMLSPNEPIHPERFWFPGCGYFLFRPKDKDWVAFVAAKKGGVIRVHRKTGFPLVDFGWRVMCGKKLWTSAWWREWSIEWEGNNTLSICGRMQQGGHLISSPIRHTALRILAFLFGQRLIPLLKDIMIFRSKNASGPEFRRRITISNMGLTIDDTLGAWPGGVCKPAPRQSLRHVASAESFHDEDVNQVIRNKRETHHLDNVYHVVTTWHGGGNKGFSSE